MLSVLKNISYFFCLKKSTRRVIIDQSKEFFLKVINEWQTVGKTYYWGLTLYIRSVWDASTWYSFNIFIYF